MIRGQATKDGEEAILPPIQMYTECAKARADNLLSIAEQKTQDANRDNKRKARLALGWYLIICHITNSPNGRMLLDS